MSRIRNTIVPILLLSVLTVVAFDHFILKDKMYGWASLIVSRPMAYIMDKASFARAFFSQIGEINRIAGKNTELTSEVLRLKALLTDIDSLENENSHLRRALDLTEERNLKVVPAGLYGLGREPAGYFGAVNRGRRSGIDVGDIAVTQEGALIGIITDVLENTARMKLVFDPTFALTAKVLNGKTAGIAKGAFDDGMYLDMVVQEDKIQEGDVIVSNGNDRFPPGITVGTVVFIQDAKGSVFKTVKITPAFNMVSSSKILIMINH